MHKDNVKYCNKCNVILYVGINWLESRAKIKQYSCNDCKQKYDREHLTDSYIRKLKLKEEVFNAYGNKCVECGEDGWQFLNIDHIMNDRSDDEKKGIYTSQSIYVYLRNNKFPKDRYQLLCSTCNQIKGAHGFFPVRDALQYSCIFCNIDLTEKNRFTLNIKNNNPICKDCILARSITRGCKSHSSRKEKKQNALNTRMDIVENYGGKCKCCGYNDYYGLSIDHINGGGKAESRALEKSGQTFYKYLRTNDYPQEKYQLLCFNCNCCKGAFGQCFHTLCKGLNTDYVSIERYIDMKYGSNTMETP